MSASPSVSGTDEIDERRADDQREAPRRRPMPSARSTTPAARIDSHRADAVREAHARTSDRSAHRQLDDQQQRAERQQPRRPRDDSVVRSRSVRLGASVPLPASARVSVESIGRVERAPPHGASSRAANRRNGSRSVRSLAWSSRTPTSRMQPAPTACSTAAGSPSAQRATASPSSVQSRGKRATTRRRSATSRRQSRRSTRAAASRRRRRVAGQCNSTCPPSRAHAESSGVSDRERRRTRPDRDARLP